MSKLAGTKAMWALEQDRMAVQITVNQIINIIYDYIPRACIREVEDKLFDAFFINGIELTSNTMRKEYEQWKTMQIDMLGLQSHLRPRQPTP